jgi:hypothetical protein
MGYMWISLIIAKFLLAQVFYDGLVNDEWQGDTETTGKAV